MINNILVVIVAYYPDMDLLRRNIDAYQDDVDRILIWDNTPGDSHIKTDFLNTNKIIVKGEGSNKGISYALNYAWKYAKKNGFRYLMTMDQDTLWHNFHNFKDDTIMKERAPIGIWAPGHGGKSVDIYEKVDFVITSGMMIPINIVDQLKGWNEYFKVDGVDNDFCCHASYMNIPIYLVNSCHITQRCGTPEIKSFGRMTFIVHNYPPNRLYEIYKNHIITFRKYRNMKRLRKSWMREWCYYRLFYLLFEKNTLRKVWAVLRGIIVGYTYKLNEIN